MSTWLQFWFKAHRSCSRCKIISKGTMAFYSSNHSYVFCHFWTPLKHSMRSILVKLSSYYSNANFFQRETLNIKTLQTSLKRWDLPTIWWRQPPYWISLNLSVWLYFTGLRSSPLRRMHAYSLMSASSEYAYLVTIFWRFVAMQNRFLFPWCFDFTFKLFIY